MNILKTLRKPHLSILLAFLILFVSCSQYESISNKSLLDEQTIEALKKGTLEVLNNPENYKISSKNGNTNAIVDEKINEAVNKYVSDDLETFKNNVLNFSNWTHDQLVSIEVAFIVMETVQDHYYNSNKNFTFNKKGAWWAPVGFAVMCAVVGAVTIGVAGVACGILYSAAHAYATR